MARAPISVVIPTLNSADELVDCLATLAEGLDAGLIRELIVTDGASNDQHLRSQMRLGLKSYPAQNHAVASLGVAARWRRATGC